jgi:hypothetical protein
MPGCFQASRCRKIEVQPESFCSCKDSDIVGERLLCSCGEELSGMYESVYLLKEKVWWYVFQSLFTANVSYKCSYLYMKQSELFILQK